MGGQRKGWNRGVGGKAGKGLLDDEEQLHNNTYVTRRCIDIKYSLHLKKQQQKNLF